MTGKIHVCAVWLAIGVLAIITLSGLSSNRNTFQALERVVVAQDKFNQDIVRQLQIQGELNDNTLNFEGTLIGQ